MNKGRTLKLWKVYSVATGLAIVVGSATFFVTGFPWLLGAAFAQYMGTAFFVVIQNSEAMRS